MAAIERYTLLAKNAKGKALHSIIMNAFSDPQVFVFGELLDLEQVSALAHAADGKPYLEALQIFAYGSYGQFKANKKLPKLNAEQTKKLKQLTLVSMAAANKTLNYDRMLTELEIKNTRELEDLIIECIYQGLLTGKMDARAKVLEVSSTMGRDLAPGKLVEMINVLTNWTANSQTLLAGMEDQVRSIAELREARKKRASDVAENIESLIKGLKAVEADKARRTEFDSQEYFEEEGRRGKRSGSRLRGSSSKRPAGTASK